MKQHRLHFSMLTYNIRKLKGYNGSSPQPAMLAKFLSHHDCDVIMCQEIAEDKTCHADPDCCQLANHLNMEHDYGANALYHDGSHGNATFSAYPVKESKNLNISTSNFEYRGALHSIIQLTDDYSCHFFNVHLGLTPRQRRKQIQMILDYIARNLQPSDPIIIAGDFNDFGGSIRKHFSKFENFHCAANMTNHTQKTWPTRRPLFQLDHIMYRNLELIETAVVIDNDTCHLSDHLPIRATFQV